MDLNKLFSRLIQKYKGLNRTSQILIPLAILLVLILVSLVISNPAANRDDSLTVMGIDVTLKLCIVMLLIYIGAYFLKKWGFRGILIKKSNQIILQETLPLSPKRALYLIQIGKQTLLIGATDQSISLISKLNNEQELEEDVINDGKFSDSFADAMQKYDNPQS
jgi:flagellar protein FliO/FliZ